MRLGALALIAILAMIALVTRSRVGRVAPRRVERRAVGADRPLEVPPEAPVPRPAWLGAALARWVDAGLLTGE